MKFLSILSNVYFLSNKNSFGNNVQIYTILSAIAAGLSNSEPL